MSVRKYRLYLLLITLVLGLAGAVYYFYYAEQEKTYREGTLVENAYVTEEILL